MSTLEKNTVFADDAIVTVAGFLSADECDEQIRITEASGYGDAPITTFRGFVMRPDIRNNTRVMIDDFTFADRLWQRMRPLVRARAGARDAIGLNERFRYYRYEPGQYFRRHRDGSFMRSPDEESLYTAIVYLNDGFEGGSTEFLDDSISIVPRRGTLLLFEHGLVHEGATVTRGLKYALRTDVMYRR